MMLSLRYCCRAFSPAISRAFVRLFACLSVTIVAGACDNDSVTVAQAKVSVGTDDWTALLSQTGIEFPAPGPLEFPADLNTHPQLRAESFVLQALLEAENVKPFSVQAQIDRVSVKQNYDIPAQSAWAYADVMRASVTVGKQDEKALSHRESISRVAMGLAGSEKNNYYVGDSQLHIDLQGNCSGLYSFSGTMQDDRVFSLTWQLSTCPADQSVGEFNQWSADAVPVSGFVQDAERRNAVSGWGWMLQRFGNLPLPGGAVFIDEARLVLDDRILLSASRSRRRSGRGPQTMLSTLRSLEQRESTTAMPAYTDLQWVDVDTIVSERSGARYPGQIRLVHEEAGIAVLLTPLVDLPELTDRLGNRWSAAVTVSGSHQGYGFVNMNPLIDGLPR